MESLKIKVGEGALDSYRPGFKFKPGIVIAPITVIII